jgi:hypothetical protein
LKIERYEKEVVRRICSGVLSYEIINQLLSAPNRIEVKSCSAVYDLNIYHDSLPEELVVCDSSIEGSYKNSKVGFIVTIHNRCLSLECYAKGSGTLLQGMRNGEVKISKT